MAVDHDELASSERPTGGRSDAMRPTRVLLGWLEDHEAVMHMLGRSPSPEDDLAALTAQIVKAQRAVRERPQLVPQEAVVDLNRGLLDELAARPDVQGAFAGLPWTVQWIDLSCVQPVQKFVYLDGPDARLAAAANGGAAELAELCFPTSQNDQIQFNVDPDGLGFTFSSRNPNLQIRSLPPQPMVVGSLQAQQQLFGVASAVVLGPGFLNVAYFRGRYFLRDGTHRAAGLLHGAVTVVPAVLVEAPSWQFVAPKPGLMTEHQATVDCPPLLTDFWEPAVSADGLQPRTQTHWRLRPERFDLPA